MIKTYLAIVVLFASISLHAQSRTAGRMVVPIGYEAHDSLRFGVYHTDRPPIPVFDSVHFNFDISWGGAVPTDPIGPMKGFSGTTYPLTDIIGSVKQRIFLPVPLSHFDPKPYAYY